MSAIAHYLLLVGLGVAPSLVWLAYYLRKDCHPEPKYLVAKTFLMGIILSPLAVLFQLLFVQAGSVAPHALDPHGPAFLLWAAFVEEVVKFFAVVMIALRSPEFDEPVDAMIYMLTAGLGFAAMENILVLFRVIPDGLNTTLSVLALRFVGATLLHTLSCALTGYFLALSWFFAHHRKKLVVFGLLLATIFHFTFNTFLSSGDNILSLAYATGLLIIMAFLVAVLFDRIRERQAKRWEYT